jgi:hypothetical protein
MTPTEQDRASEYKLPEHLAALEISEHGEEEEVADGPGDYWSDADLKPLSQITPP